MYLIDSLMIVFCFVFLILMIVSPRMRIIFGMLTLILSFSLAASLQVVSIPYQVENIADNTVGSAITGVQTVDTARGWGMFFFGIGWFAFAYVSILIVEVVTGRVLIPKREGE